MLFDKRPANSTHLYEGLSNIRIRIWKMNKAIYGQHIQGYKFTIKKRVAKFYQSDGFKQSSQF